MTMNIQLQFRDKQGKWYDKSRFYTADAAERVANDAFDSADITGARHYDVRPQLRNYTWVFAKPLES